MRITMSQLREEGILIGKEIGLKEGEEIGLRKGEKIGIRKGELTVLRKLIQMNHLNVETVLDMIGIKKEEREIYQKALSVSSEMLAR